MSEGTNIRQNLQNIPSIFEITAAETLDNLIYPALQRIFDYIDLRFDFKLIPKWLLTDAISPLIAWGIQYLYLRRRDASFGESFYGLQRISTKGSFVSRKQLFISATLLIFIPYVERKLKAKAENRQITNRQEYMLKALHAYKVCRTMHMFLYLASFTESHSPILKLLKLNVRYPLDDGGVQDDKATYALLKLLEIMAFFLQFTQWWYFTKERSNIGSNLKNPKPAENLSQVPAGKCPICLMEVNNPTACAISGYVYCWRCIINHMRKNRTCPMTDFAITTDDLVRICES